MRRVGLSALLAVPAMAMATCATAGAPGVQYAQQGQYGGQPGQYGGQPGQYGGQPGQYGGQPGQYPQGQPPGQYGQPGPGGGPPGTAGGAEPQGSPADQLVGLFGATCLHFAGDVGGLRQFLGQQGAQELPVQASQAFLGSRPGKAYNASIPDLQLALLSLDDGGCEAVADKAAPGEVVSVFQQAAKENGLPLRAMGSSPGARGTTINSYEATVGARQMHILITTGATAPQAAIALVPR